MAAVCIHLTRILISSIGLVINCIGSRECWCSLVKDIRRDKRHHVFYSLFVLVNREQWQKKTNEPRSNDIDIARGL